MITDLVSPRSLPSPPPLQISSQGQPTSEELVGSNYRQSGSPTELALAPTSKQPRIPHVLGEFTFRIVSYIVNVQIFQLI